MSAASKIRTSDGPKVLIDRSTAADRLSLSIQALDRLIKHKQLEAVRIGRRVLIQPSALEALASAGAA